MSAFEIDKNTAEAKEISLENSSDDNDEYANKPFTYNVEERKLRLAKGPSKRDIFVIVCAGFALISDGYQNNVMSMLNAVFGILYPKEYTATMKTNVSNASLIATIFGQVTIGLTADYIGRKWSIVTGSLFLIVGTVMCAASHGKTVEGMFWMLIISRGITGFGIGAEYPSSSVSASEAANESVKRRGGAFILVTNLPLSFGGPFALIIFLIVIQITKTNLEALWRTMFAIGAFWPLSIFYFRMKMATSELYKKNAIKQRAPYWLALKYYWPRLIGTCLSWFLYDFVTFPNGVFSAGIIGNIIPKSESHNLQKIAEWNLLLGIIAIPGVIVGAYLTDKIGRKYTIMIGFSGYIVFGLAVGLAYERVKAHTALFIILYGLMMSFGNLGPGDGMGLVASESFATPIRGTCYGISAAIGKVGAVVGTKTFTPIQTNLGVKWTFIIAACCGVAGVLVTFFFVPHLRADDLMEQDVKFKNYLVENGWKGHFGTKENDEESNTESEIVKV